LSPEKTADGKIVAAWLASAHARTGVNCSACHQPHESAWSDRVEHASCRQCHADETAGFVAGRHGMRLERGLAPMSPALARLPMKATSRQLRLECTSCHGAHGFDTAYAVVEACQGCHDDRHSRSYKQSLHYTLWESGAGTGVSCAGCHMPRGEHAAEAGRVLVQHNQNDNLRPNEKMLRPVCLQCHGLRFALDALADRALIENNFSGRPSVQVRSIDMARENMLRDMERRLQE
jgi:formate-dependent nitrite reductase cytochrome c552 subunit